MQKKGCDVIADPVLNKGTSFTREERDQLNLRGLLPHMIRDQEVQKKRVLANLDCKESDIEKYIFLTALSMRNKRLFYAVLIENIDKLMPYIYTPTVGQACKEFNNIFRSTSGFYVTPEDANHIRKILDNWTHDDVQVVVLTDGERILGLGDLGANGIGIPIGKLQLYVACAGIDPSKCLPIMLDVGTNNMEFLEDPMYLGYPHKRLTGQKYTDLVDELIHALRDKYPNVLIQFEDFLTPNAYKLLKTYQNQILCFNDDIQGTAAVALAGVYAASRLTGVDYKHLRVMFLGAGSAATGIADLMVLAFIEHQLSIEQAHKRLWFVDTKGLVVASRTDLMSHNAPYQHEEKLLNFIDSLNTIKPHVLIGASGAPGVFTQEVIEIMSNINKTPVIFALSNPTTSAECTAEQAYRWSKGNAIFVSGSPFDKVTYQNKVFQPGQGNNAYVFPGIGLGAVIAKARYLPDTMFLIAARVLAEMVSQEDLDRGTLYPPLSNIREISIKIAIGVAKAIYESGLTDQVAPDNLEEYIRSQSYNTDY